MKFKRLHCIVANDFPSIISAVLIGTKGIRCIGRNPFIKRNAPAFNRRATELIGYLQTDFKLVTANRVELDFDFDSIGLDRSSNVPIIDVVCIGATGGECHEFVE